MEDKQRSSPRTLDKDEIEKYRVGNDGVWFFFVYDFDLKLQDKSNLL